MNRKIVVTGMGLISPAGNGKKKFLENCKKGVSYIQKVSKFDTTLFRSKYAGLVDFKAKAVVPKAVYFQTDACTHYGFGATEGAFEDARLDLNEVNKDRFGVVIGNCLGGCDFGQREMYNLYKNGPYAISPYMMIAWFYAATIGQLTIRYKLKGYTKTIVSERASGSDAIGFAYQVIKNNNADIMLAGGVEAPINEYGFLCIDQSGETIEHDQGDCSTAYRPFSKGRQGFFPAEGAALVILEEYEHALRRNAPIYGEVVGYAATTDGYHPVRRAPDGIQLSRAIMLALDQAGISPKDLSYINLNATGTHEADIREATAIKKALGSCAETILTSAPKSMYGHTLGAAGAFDFIETALAVKEDLLLPTINYRKPDPECGLNIVADRPVETPVHYGMSISCGFGGQNSVLLMKKFLN